MTILLPALAVAVAASCIWLTVAKWTLAALPGGIPDSREIATLTIIAISAAFGACCILLVVRKSNGREWRESKLVIFFVSACLLVALAYFFFFPQVEQ